MRQWHPGRWISRRRAATLVATVMVIGAFAGACVVNDVANLRPGPNEYNIAAWEVRNLPGKWLFLAGELVRGSLSEDEQDEILRRFFELNARIDSLDNETSDALSRGRIVDAALTAELDALRRERARIQNQVEATLEWRIAQAIKEAGLTRDFLVRDVVWPPVDANFTDSPRALARSPRDRIELLGSTLLVEGLTLAEAEAIEAHVAAEENLSVLSFGTAGIGAYPSIIAYPSSYERALDVVAHEWMHNYLFFYPLGFNYYGSNDLRTMNETVADLVGKELAQIVLERWPLPALEPPPDAPTVGGVQTLDLRAELRRLRGEVDVLLAQGRVEEAEALMEERRVELADQGYFIRKINQAYFAYLNLYAGEAGSVAATNPIGPKIDELRARSPSLRAFVSVIRGITTVEGLDAALDASP